MAFQTPAFMSRVFRPLTSSVRLGITGESNAGSSTSAIPEGAEKATFGAGCYWGTEHLYRKHFAGKGLYDAKVGFMGGHTRNPTYREVCTGSTGHVEVAQLTYDPSKLSYRQLVEFFYRMHDPTQLNRQGPDVGVQYRSVIFTHSEEQEKIAKEVTAKVNEQWLKPKGQGEVVASKIEPAGTFWEAEEGHQEYLEKNPTGYECPSHWLRTEKVYPALK